MNKRTKIGKTWGTLAALVPLLLAGRLAAEEWDYAWTAETEPETDGVFVVDGSKPREYSLEDGVLRLNSTQQGFVIWQVDAEKSPQWDGSEPFVVEFRMRAGPKDGGAEASAQIVTSNGRGKYFNFLLSDPEWHDYKLVYDGQRALLFQDGGETPIAESDGQMIHGGKTPNHLYFGDGGTATVGGLSEWKFLRWRKGDL